MQGKSPLERLSESLYERGREPRAKERAHLSEETSELPRAFGTERAGDAPRSPSRRSHRALVLLLGSALFFSMALGIALYMFLGGNNVVSSGNITLEVIGPSLVDGGKEASVSVVIRNENATALELADLIIEYPEGTRSTKDITKPLPRIRESLGTIGPGETVKRAASAVLFGEEGSTRRIGVILEYRVEGSNAIFVKEGGIDLVIGSSPVTLTIDAPDEGVSGKEVVFRATIVSNATAPIRNLVLEAEYPFGFTVSGVEPETASGDNVWEFGDLLPRQKRVVEVRGTVEGQDEEERVFRFSVGSREEATEVKLQVPFLTIPHALTIKRPFVSGTLSIQGRTGKTLSVPQGGNLSGTILWQNNLDTEVYDLEIEARLEGQALNKGSVGALRGFYRSTDSTIIWNKTGDESLATIPPGASGEVEFSFTPTIGSGSGTLKNPELLIEVSVRARRVSHTQVPETISSVTATRLLVVSPVDLSAKALYASGPFTNRGGVPPRADKETTYTIVFSVRNPSNTIAGAKVTTVLPPSTVLYPGNTPATEVLSYNPTTRALVWELGEVKAGVGSSLPAREVSFQVGFTPSLTQVGSVPSILGKTVLTGEDRFAQVKVESEYPPLTTRIASDPSFQNGMEVVQP